MKDTRFSNVWDALEESVTDAANMKARAALLMAVSKVVASWKVTQAESARRLGISQPRLNDLLRGRINKFSVDSLMLLASEAGLAVTCRVSRKAA